jgi:hypothetical protein
MIKYYIESQQLKFRRRKLSLCHQEREREMQRLVRCEVEELSHKMEKRNETFERFMPKADRDDVVDNQLLTHRRPPSVSLSPPTTSVSFISLHSTERKVKEKNAYCCHG